MNIQFSAPFFEGATSFAMCIFGISVGDHVAVALIAEAQENTSLCLINHTMLFIHLHAADVMCACMLLVWVSCPWHRDPYHFLGDRAMFCSKEVTLGGFLNSFKEMLLLLGRRWTKKAVLVNYQ